MNTPHDHQHASRFTFDLPRNTAVFVCTRVHEGAPILSVSHDDEGDWQFLCGTGAHGDGGADKPVLSCLECVVAGDLTLNDIADLDGNHSAERKKPGAAWERFDHGEDFINQTVASHGWAVQLIAAGDGDDEPAFAYTVGLFKSYGHPELITIGLAPEVMHTMLNACGERIKEGEKLPVGELIDDVLDDYSVRLREVRKKASFEAHVGYAIWFNGGRDFPLLQLLWPDKKGRFPGEKGAASALDKGQPLLP